MLSRTYGRLIEAEAVRERVFAALERPVAFGQPPAWLAMMAEALALDRQGNATAAQALRATAREETSARSGTIESAAFHWIMDADPRIGAALEVVVDGQYRWLPIDHLKELRAEPPKAMRDLVWQPVTLRLTTETELAAFVPSRYRDQNQILTMPSGFAGKHAGSRKMADNGASASACSPAIWVIMHFWTFAGCASAIPGPTKMASAFAKDRLQPSLLDRLTDELAPALQQQGLDRHSLDQLLNEVQRKVLSAMLADERLDRRPPAPDSISAFANLTEDGRLLLDRIISIEISRRQQLRRSSMLSAQELRAVGTPGSAKSA